MSRLLPALTLGLIDVTRHDRVTVTSTVSARYGLFDRIELDFSVPYVAAWSRFRLSPKNTDAERDKNIPGPFKEGPPTPESLHENGMCVGNPTEVRATVQKFVDVGLDQLVTIPVVGRAVPHETCIEGLRIFGEKVIPEFRS